MSGNVPPEVLEKYRAAANIANQCMAEVIAAAVPGKRIYELCKLGNDFVVSNVKTVYPKRTFSRGLAFPVCLSVNNVAGHYSPLSSDQTKLVEGDLVKVDVGVQIDGYVSVAAHTFVSTNDPSVPITGPRADVICAAYFAIECALRRMRPGFTNKDVAQTIMEVAKQFNCTPVEGVLSHSLKQHVLDGNEVIHCPASEEYEVETVEMQPGMVFGLDVVLSTGNGKIRESSEAPTIFKRMLDSNYQPKIKATQQLLTEINRRNSTMPFGINMLESEGKAKLGLVEALKNKLLEPYPVFEAKRGEYIAQFKYTVAITATETVKLNEHFLPYVSSEISLSEDYQNNVMAMDLVFAEKIAKKKKKKKGANKVDAEAPGDEEPETEPATEAEE